jgi:hypothetical protein
MIYATIEHLKEAELHLPRLLQQPEIWNSLDVDYYPPRVERLWTQYDNEHRLFIHLIHPTDEPCLFHKHRWPASFKMIDGSYEMAITYCEGEINSDEAYKLPMISRFIMNTGSYYQMTDTHTLHYVKPMGGISTSLMLSGPLYPEADIRKEVVDRELKPLSDLRKLTILQWMQKIYPLYED